MFWKGDTMNIDQIITQIGFLNHSYTQVHGGKDSLVYKVTDSAGTEYALRLLPKDNVNQFHTEKKMMEIAASQAIPVPKIYTVMVCGEHAVMLMEWAGGQTVLAELQVQPENARLIGQEFGKMQATINSIVMHDDEVKASWLTPDEEEEELYYRINAVKKSEARLLHLDFHPLNVLIENGKITAVIDWANASFGDYRFDFARTYSILEQVGKDHFAGEVLVEFEKGWKEGYEQEISPLENMDLFNAWAGLRLKK